MPNPLVSVVVPVWNEESRVEKCLDSLSKQTFIDFEVIVVNDGSTDNSKKIIMEFCSKDSRFNYYESKTNNGIGNALNLGFEKTKGDYLTWTSADSWVMENYILELKNSLDSNPNAVLSYSNWFVHDEMDNGKETIVYAPEYDRKKLRIKCDIGPCWLFKKFAKEKAGPYCQDVCEDYYMHLLLSEIGNFVKVDKVLGCWRNHKSNTTNRISLPNKWLNSSIAKAKARWKQSKYKIAYLCPNLDAASVGFLLMNVVNDLSDNFSVRHILGDKNHLMAKTDLDLYDKKGLKKESLEILSECDIVHLNNEYPDFNLEVFELIKNKPIIIHMHAGPQQWHNEKINHWKAQNLDLYTCVTGLKNLQWIPNFIPVTNGLNITCESFYTPIERNNSKLKFLCHHNYLSGKGTMQLSDIVKGMSETFYKSKINDLIDCSISANLKIPLLDHLMIKKNFDVCFDTITHGYCGMASWESMAQGAAVICKMDDLTIKEYQNFFGSCPPIINPRSVDDVVASIRKLIENKSYAKEIGQECRSWMIQNYNAEKILVFYEKIYMKAINGRIQQRQNIVPYTETQYFEGWRSTIPCSRSNNYIRLL